MYAYIKWSSGWCRSVLEIKSALVLGNLEGKAISGCFRSDGFILFFLEKK